MVVLLFILLFFGSKGIPDMARTLGRAMRQMRDASNEVQREINMKAHDVKQAVEEQRKAFQQQIQEDGPSLPRPGTEK